MTVGEFASELGCTVIAGKNKINREITGVYTGDLLSRVMANAKAGEAWITIHTHVNTIAVAVLNDLSCIVLAEGMMMDAASVAKADEEGIPVLTVEKPAYRICCEAGRLGL